jgi:ribonuclease HII
METVRHPGYTPRRDSGLTGYERVLARAGLGPIAGIDEAGRGACAGPLVVAAVTLNPRRRSDPAGLADSKALTAPAREAAYVEIVKHALGWHVVVIPPSDIDRLGLHVCNVAGMRRALAGLARRPGYVLTDGFPVRGLTVPALAMWKGDEVAACVAAASIVAKVTRDRIMKGLHHDYPEYGFARHKGYSTPSHMAALAEHGPCPEHRGSFANVVAVVRQRAGLPPVPMGQDPAAGDALTAAEPLVALGEGGLPAAGPFGPAGDEAAPAAFRHAALPAAAVAERDGDGAELTYG